MPILKPAARAKRAERIRFVAAKAGSHIATQEDNGDETLYPEKWGSYSKGLAHDTKGDVRIRSYNSMLRALKSGAAADFDKIDLGGPSRWLIRRPVWLSRWRAEIPSPSN